MPNPLALDRNSRPVPVTEWVGAVLLISTVEERPTNPSQLFVSNAHNGTGLGTVSAFTDSGAGALTSIGSSPVADQQTAPCWVTISPDGRSLFAVNTGSGTISRYSIAPGGR
jgi:6-phosphogluconolactonase (cycloisomerase 2 family)